MAPMTPSQAAEQDMMVEGLLMFLAILVSSRTNLGMNIILIHKFQFAHST